MLIVIYSGDFWKSFELPVMMNDDDDDDYTIYQKKAISYFLTICSVVHDDDTCLQF